MTLSFGALSRSSKDASNGGSRRSDRILCTPMCRRLPSAMIKVSLIPSIVRDALTTAWPQTLMDDINNSHTSSSSTSPAHQEDYQQETSRISKEQKRTSRMTFREECRTKQENHFKLSHFAFNEKHHKMILRCTFLFLCVSPWQHLSCSL